MLVYHTADFSSMVVATNRVFTTEGSKESQEQCQQVDAARLPKYEECFVTPTLSEIQTKFFETPTAQMCGLSSKEITNKNTSLKHPLHKCVDLVVKH